MPTDEFNHGKRKPSLRERLMSHLVQIVPDEIAICEFNCTKAACSHSEWKECKRRLDSLEHKKPADAKSTIGEDLSLKEIAKDQWVAADPCCVSAEHSNQLRPKVVSLK